MRKIIPVLVILLFAGCSKEENPVPEEKTSIEIYNGTNESYEIYFDALYKGIIQAGNYKAWDISEGSHIVQAKEHDYFINQTVYVDEIYCVSGCRTDWYFPDK